MLPYNCRTCAHPVAPRGDRYPPWCPACGARFDPYARAERAAPAADTSQAEPAASPTPADTAPVSTEERAPDPPPRPSFQGRTCAKFRANRNYRVILEPDRMLFYHLPNDYALYVVTGEPGGARSAVRRVTSQFGLLGGLVGEALEGMLSDGRAAFAALEQRLVTAPLDELAEDDTESFFAAPEDLTDASLDPRSFWHALWFPAKHDTGLFRFHHAARGKMTFEFFTPHDLLIAYETLPAWFGDALTMNVVWDRRKYEFVGRRG